MAVKLKTLVWAIVAVAVFCILALVAVVGAAFFYMSRHIETKSATASVAATEFAEIKADFPGQRPLIELDRRGKFLRANTEGPTAPKTTTPDELWVMAFDPSDGRIVRFNIPFWILRMKADATIDLNGNRMDLEDLRLTVHDLERKGPSLIVDHQASDGERVLVWSK